MPAASQKRPVVFGTGLIALDVVFSGERPGHSWLAAGGTCGNVLAALSYLSWRAYPIARLNGDAASTLLQSDLARWNVGLDFASQQPSSPTPIIVQKIDRRPGEAPRHRFLLTCPRCRAWLPSFRPLTREAALGVVERLSDDPAGLAPQVFFFDRSSRGTLLLATAFAERGALVVFEPSGVGDSALYEEALAIAHVLKYSRERMPGLAERRLPARPRLLEIETRGERGLRFRSAACSVAAWREQSAVSAPVVRDTAGAGDWCTAALLSVLGGDGVRGLERAAAADLERSLRFAQGAAALACAFEGARGVMEALTPNTFKRTAASLACASNETVAFDAATPSALSPSSLSSGPMESVCPSCR